jgi:DNA-damage-inducible protein J
MKTATIRARLEPGLKKQAERVLGRVGLTTTEAITLFYRQVVLHRGLPFAVRVPNQTTRQTMSRTNRGEDLHRYASAGEMFEDMDL